jgi:hypothetical protein
MPCNYLPVSGYFLKGMPCDDHLTADVLFRPSARMANACRVGQLKPIRRQGRIGVKFALSQNSKSLHAGSNPSATTVIIGAIVTALDGPLLSRDSWEPPSRSQDWQTANQLHG